jgi:hypothetical protein
MYTNKIKKALRSTKNIIEESFLIEPFAKDSQHHNSSVITGISTHSGLGPMSRFEVGFKFAEISNSAWLSAAGSLFLSKLQQI